MRTSYALFTWRRKRVQWVYAAKTFYDYLLDGTVLQPGLSGQLCGLGATYQDVSAMLVSCTPSELNEATSTSIYNDRG